jgi:hypothetical protein
MVIITPFLRRVLWSGPYGIIFGAYFQVFSTSRLVCFMLDIPAIETWKIGSITITEKYSVYLLAFQLMVTNFPNSFVIAICGIVSGFVYRSEVLKLNLILPPQFLVDFFSKHVYTLVNSPMVLPRREEIGDDNRPVNQRNAQINLFQQLNQRNPRPQQENIQQVPRVDTTTFVPNPQYVTMLCDMGFDRTEVIQALQYGNNNLERATEILIA